MSDLEKWLLFIKTDDKKVREKLAEENPMIAKANTVMNTFYSNEKERAAYQAAWRYESDRISMIKETEEKAMAKGREEGIYTNTIETVKKCLSLKMPIETISLITGLSKEEIATL